MSPPKRQLSTANAKDWKIAASTVETAMPCYLIHPTSRSKVMWDSWSVLILVYTVFLVPMRLGFDIEDFCPEPIWIFEAVIDSSFMLDLVLSFFTAVYVPDSAYSGGCNLSE